jgi:hypothetical protein
MDSRVAGTQHVGANVCHVHGGAAPQVQAAARRRLQQATDALAAKLLGIALDDGTSEAVRLAAIRDALDRGGVNAKAAFEVSLAPYEQVLAGLADVAHIPRAESRARRGVPDAPAPEPELPEPPELPASDDDTIVDAEAVPDWASYPPLQQQRPGLQTLEQAAQDTPQPAVLRRVRSRRV